MGVVRTTFAMTSGLLIRRRQSVLFEGRDPFAPQHPAANSMQVMKLNQPKNRDRSLLRLMNVVQRSEGISRHRSWDEFTDMIWGVTGLLVKNQQNAIELLSSNVQMLENLRYI
jgi:hypothetical protein